MCYRIHKRKPSPLRIVHIAGFAKLAPLKKFLVMSVQLNQNGKKLKSMNSEVLVVRNPDCITCSYVVSESSQFVLSHLIE